MTTHREAIVFLTSITAAVAPSISGCTSSSSPNATANDAGTGGGGAGGGGAGGKAGADAQSSTDDASSGSLKLQWSVVIQPAAITPIEVAPDAGGGSDASVTKAAPDGGGSVGGPPKSNPLQGVEACVYQNSAIPCATSAADGSFTLTGLPMRKNVALTFKKSGYYSYLLSIQTASADMDGRSYPVNMAPSGGGTPNLGFKIDLQNKGIIQVIAIAFAGSATMGGATVDAGGFATVPGTGLSMSPASGKGPYFVNANNEFDLSAKSFVGVAANYYNVDPGTYTLTFANANFDCEPVLFPFADFGWPLTTPAHSLSAVVAAGYITGSVVALCSKNAGIVSTDGG